MGAAMKYIRVTENGFSKARLIPEDSNLFKLIKTDRDKPWFYSTYRYSEEHKKHFDENNSVAGIRDVTTNMIWWDFDAKKIEDARVSTLKLVGRLIGDGFPEDTIKVNYSGNKGFHVIINVDKELTPYQVEQIAAKYAGDLDGFDTSLYDANQVLRIPLSQHEKSKVYCSPITIDELKDNTAKQLKELAKTSPSDFNEAMYLNYYKVAVLSDDLLAIEEAPPKTNTIEGDLDFDTSCLSGLKKPSYLDDARWYLVNGFFRGSETADIGERNHAFLCLAATFKNQGYDKQVVKGMLQGVAETQAQRTGETVFADYDLDLIIKQVYSDTWKGGQFSIRDPKSWLHKYAVRMGLSTDDKEENYADPITIGDLESGFIKFVENIDQNTIPTGIPSLDEAMPITTGQNVGIIGAASSGKTALALEILKHTSQKGIPTVIASIDMHRNRIFEKLLYKVSGLPRKDLYHKAKTGQLGPIIDKVKKDYGNVWFYDRSSASVADIRRYVLEVEQKTGEKVKLVMIDYFERINSDISDDTASSKRICNELQDMINDLDIAMITLVQPNKFSLGGGPDKPILNYTSIKGSSFLYQSFRSILSLWRPFFRPDMTEHDHYMQMAILKNDLGELGMFNYGWNGKRGEIREMEDIEHKELKDLLKMKDAVDNPDNKKDDGWG